MAGKQFDNAGIKKEPADDCSHISNVKLKVCPRETESLLNNTLSGSSLSNNFKDENGNIQWAKDQNGSLETAICTKQELDIGPTEFQPSDMQFMLRQCKPDPDEHRPSWIGKNISLSSEPLDLDGTESTEEQNNSHHHGNHVWESKHDFELCSLKYNANMKISKIHKEIVDVDTSKQFFSGVSPSNAPILATYTNQVRNPKKLECDYCHKLFALKSNLIVHMYCVHTHNTNIKYNSRTKQYAGVAKQIECDHCLKKFARKSNLRVHNCNVELVLNEHIRFLKHRKRKNDLNATHASFKCDSCSKVFHYQSKLRHHMQRHAVKKKFQCKLCDMKFCNKSDYSKHTNVHKFELPFQCLICDKKYRLRSSFVGHMQMHTEERPFECKVCNKDFKRFYTLDRHAQTHSQDLQYQCEVCGKRFCRVDSLQKHSLVHTEPRRSQRPRRLRYQCDTCDKMFPDRYGFIHHLRVTLLMHAMR